MTIGSSLGSLSAELDAINAGIPGNTGYQPSNAWFGGGAYAGDNANSLGYDLGSPMSPSDFAAAKAQVNNTGGNFLGNTWNSMSGFDKLNAVGSGITSALGAWNGFQANKQAKRQLAFQKDAFNKQYAAQRNLTNSQLSDRQATRVARDQQNGTNRFASVAEYMDKYGIK